MKQNKTVLQEKSVKTGDMVKSLSQDWDGLAKVVSINVDTFPALLTVALSGDDATFQTTLDDAEVIFDN